MYGFEVSVIRMIIKEKNKNMKDMPTTTMNTIPKNTTKTTKTTKNSTKKNTMDREIELINFE